MFSQIRPFLAIVACLLIGAGCGQKGLLYLPDDPSQMEVIEPAGTESGTPTSDDVESDDEDEEDDPESSSSDQTPSEGMPNE